MKNCCRNCAITRLRQWDFMNRRVVGEYLLIERLPSLDRASLNEFLYKRASEKERKKKKWWSAMNQLSGS